LSRERIAARVAELAGQIVGDLDSRPLALAALMTGSLIFAADLIRQLPVRMRLHLVNISSYPGTATVSKGPRLLGPLPEDLTGQTVLLLDDILDSGRTLAKMVDVLKQAGAASVRTCVLLAKPPRLRAPEGLQAADYVGFDIGEEFVVGYGLDYDDYYRNLPDIAVLKGDLAS
jgi:hypoxanthine phosphoribosyltransferase